MNNQSSIILKPYYIPILVSTCPSSSMEKKVLISYLFQTSSIFMMVILLFSIIYVCLSMNLIWEKSHQSLTELMIQFSLHTNYKNASFLITNLSLKPGVSIY